MCNFFTFGTDGKGKQFYFNANRRKELLKNNPINLNPDSHASVAVEFDVDEDCMNKYEYNPLLDLFTVDQINSGVNDSLSAKDWVKKLDFKTIVPELVVKPIIPPFKIEPPEITEVHIELLRQWDSVRDSVRAYTSSFFILPAWKYITATGGVNPFQSCIDLWEMGIVPSFDGKVWRLHTKNGIAWEGKL